ncbi:MAG: hypothetical protein ACKVI6_00525 [Candidatus Poseidoniales archaeon]|jgi:hypothetical protein|tara:strand:- start:4066 stop:8034 length:3969 start_codon:yes stop_codon:yes gene_type:complete
MLEKNIRTITYNSEVLEQESKKYQEWLDEKTEEVYNLASKAKLKNLDFENYIEIPRASDLASRTEKLLQKDYLKDLSIEDDLRKLLKEYDRETTSIKIGVDVAKRKFEETKDLQISIDCGLRVGLAVLTEAVLVAPLEGIGDVRILNNVDGSEFLSIDFCGPIRAAGGTAQALGVLIGDMIRRELGVSRYIPTTDEVERVKEEFGLYRVGLQYKPPPEEIETIVRACPVMINGEETEKNECAGFKEVRNVINSNGTPRTRIRGGVMLVIGEGLCLKAPKIKKHVERLKIAGWEFISDFADKGKKKEEGVVFKSRTIPKITRFMDDVIAGRPIFGEPGEPGGFRLRYGRSRVTGLAAAGINPITMEAMGGFLSVGTQMKTERPGKACAVTPCIDIDGPLILDIEGNYKLIKSIEEWHKIENKIHSIWDSGEILIGFGEFLENNKNLVPSSYSKDWWAADLAEALDHPDKVDKFAKIINIKKSKLPLGVPFTGAINRGGENPIDRNWRKRDWISFLKNCKLNWDQVYEISQNFATAVPPPWNIWWSDLPIVAVPLLVDALVTSGIEYGNLRLKEVVKNWNINNELPGSISEEILEEFPKTSEIKIHGVIKCALMTLGLEHHHEGQDIIIPRNWEGLLDGLGLKIKSKSIIKNLNYTPYVIDRISKLKAANIVINEERERSKILKKKRENSRREATTGAMQSGLDSSETERVGETAANKIIDKGPRDLKLYQNAMKLVDDNKVEKTLWLVRNLSSIRWEDAVPCRIGARMGRPEKSGIREMKPMVHALYPIGGAGGPQRLMQQASKKVKITVEMSPRICGKCGKNSGHIICHNRVDQSNPIECGGRTSLRTQKKQQRRRIGERTHVPIESILEVKRRSLGLERLPERIKAMKELISRLQTPEPIEKGILRAKHNLSVFRDGTARYDMIDVPITHFRPSEIGTPWKSLYNLGYNYDMYGKELKSNEQILELFPQDFIPSINGKDHLISTCKFIDELLIRFYKMEPFYNVKSELDLVGQLGIGLAPHTSGGVLCRIIGWTSASAGYAHPLFHAAKRRNCDGDEDSIMLLLDGLLNFSRSILPSGRGGKMDAPLVLSTRINPSEIDKEALNVDCSWNYSSSFYESTLTQPHPNGIINLVDLVSHREGTIGDKRGYGWTHDSGPLDAGPKNSSYKTLKSMKDKMDGQLNLGKRLRAVDATKVASKVIQSHFLPDMRGNMMAFTRQSVRCVKCGEKYRRMPLAGKCIKRKTISTGFDTISRDDDGSLCNGNVILTVSKGNVKKYIQITKDVIEEFGVDMYTKQRVEWTSDSVDSLFNNDSVTVMTLEDFF